MWVAWHLKSAPSMDQWFALSNRVRRQIVNEVERCIDIHNGDLDE